ncbi:hypothetical protein [Planomicrobium sp. Y74]|uniref:hypothetical protein n=1 Tax=Planomicrobium sp. Y74 TaxID=2478977 RepID=UPI000EF5211B|nr:hypothetical protein [Planomicrobium sp. Y74]RLQ92118.1 hypothetical protein D9754_04860 [Planomicrobium sp. Y74]
MKTEKLNEEKAKTFATYVITVSTHLSPEELNSTFHPNLITNNTLELNTLNNESTKLVIENMELTAVELIENN